MKVDKWVKRWEVPRSDKEGVWVVAVDRDGQYGCSCPVWKFKRQVCHHIRQVQEGEFCTVGVVDKPKYQLWHVPTPVVEDGILKVPLIALPDKVLMEATICWAMLANGYSMQEVREIRGHIPREWTREAIMSHVARHGPAVYPKEWFEKKEGDSEPEM